MFPSLVSAALLLPSPTAAVPQFTPLSASVLSLPRSVVGTDGRRHVVYEVLVQNTAEVRLDVRSLRVRSGSRSLMALSGADLRRVITNVLGEPVEALAPGQGARIWLNLPLSRGARIPRRLAHRLTVAATLTNGESRVWTFDAAPTGVSRRPALRLSAPLRGGPYLNFNGCCALSPHRIALAQVNGTDYLSERFASDFIGIDGRGRGASGDLTRNESFFTFGEPVLAVGDGRIVRTLDGVAENVPLSEPPGHRFDTRTIVGNQVVLKLRDGRYAAYGHLRRGSVRVRRGQAVRSGQVIGEVGNTGQSGGAHLHFQLSDGRDPIASDGLPYVFGRFNLLGRVSNVDAFLTGTANADLRLRAPAARRRGQLPLHATVVSFPR